MSANVVDYTQGKKRGTAVCPQCGKRGLARRYTDGSRAYFHKTIRHIVTECCYLSVKRLSKLEAQ